MCVFLVSLFLWTVNILRVCEVVGDCSVEILHYIQNVQQMMLILCVCVFFLFFLTWSSSYVYPFLRRSKINYFVGKTKARQMKMVNAFQIASQMNAFNHFLRVLLTTTTTSSFRCCFFLINSHTVKHTENHIYMGLKRKAKENPKINCGKEKWASERVGELVLYIYMCRNAWNHQKLIRV